MGRNEQELNGWTRGKRVHFSTVRSRLFCAQVRRVEEQEEMLKLLARDANKVYDCLHEAFPSVGDGFTPRYCTRTDRLDSMTANPPVW